MLSKFEVETLDQQDLSQRICDKCGATLLEYRRGGKCTAALDEYCPGFDWVEDVLAKVTAPRRSA